MGRSKWDRVEVHEPITKYTFSNLKSNSIFEFRLKAKNDVGLSEYSEIQKLKTWKKKKAVSGKNKLKL